MEKDRDDGTCTGLPAKIVGSRPQRAALNSRRAGLKLDRAALVSVFLLRKHLCVQVRIGANASNVVATR